jgi:mannose-1-phosphate guanylyltransferase/mannose-6-phosphate isomerase
MVPVVNGMFYNRRMFSYIIILAGGSGTRLWPASTSTHPKQFMPLAGGSFFRRALERASLLAPERGILVVTGEAQTAAAMEESQAFLRDHPTVSGLHILPEPVGRNTAPAVAYALAAARAEGAPGDSDFLLMTSDHLIEPLPVFLEDARKAETLAASGHLACFGIPPRYAATGYGYIEAAEALGPGRRASSFREKPDRTTAEAFLASGNFFWNSGMYAFRADMISAEMETYSRAIPEAFRALRGQPEIRAEGGVRIVRGWEGLKDAYARTPAISLDYAVSEKSRKVALVEATFSWDDVGSWDEMARLFPQTGSEVYSVESRDCFVYSDMPVALCGVSDITVVIQNGAALVVRKGASQLVKDAVEAIKGAGRKDLL